MQRATYPPIVAASVVLLFASASDGLYGPSFEQDATRAQESFESDCRACHADGVPDLHHVLYGQLIAQETHVPYPDADGNGIPDPSYGCLNCHDASFSVVRDCVVCHTSPTGSVPDGAGMTGAAVMATRTGAVDLTLSWDPSCEASDTDYAVYEGPLGSFANHAPILCSTGGNLWATFPLPPGSAYYLVVARNHWSEGSYGLDGNGMQRPPSVGACLAQSIGCAWP